MMVNHHAPAALELMRLVQDDAGILLPVLPSAEQRQAVERLHSLNGEAFRRAYFAHQVDAHQRAVEVFEQGMRQAPTEELRRYFSSHLPLLRTHLDIARRYLAELD